jgi:hypothetical protein
MTEIWKTVPSWYGYYEVSNKGRLRNRHTGRMLKPSLWRGYYCTRLSIDGSGKTQFIHCLVAEAFIGRRPSGLEINHKDGNKQNNKTENLEYVTAGDNVRHAFAHGLFGPRNGEFNANAKLYEDAVIDIRTSYASRTILLEEFLDRYAAKYTVPKSTILSVVYNRCWKGIGQQQRRRVRITLPPRDTKGRFFLPEDGELLQ